MILTIGIALSLVWLLCFIGYKDDFGIKPMLSFNNLLTGALKSMLIGIISAVVLVLAFVAETQIYNFIN